MVSCPPARIGAFLTLWFRAALAFSVAACLASPARCEERSRNTGKIALDPPVARAPTKEREKLCSLSRPLEVEAYRKQLQGLSPSTNPALWAQTTVYLSNELILLAQCRNDTALETQSIDALHAVLNIRKDILNFPYWAELKHAFGVAMISYYEKEHDHQFGLYAISILTEALTEKPSYEFFMEYQVPYVSTRENIHNALGDILSALGQHEGKRDLLIRALGEYETAIEFGSPMTPELVVKKRATEALLHRLWPQGRTTWQE
jgi:hypothetical protein